MPLHCISKIKQEKRGTHDIPICTRGIKTTRVWKSKTLLCEREGNAPGVLIISPGKENIHETASRKKHNMEKICRYLTGNSFLRDIEDVYYFYREFVHLQAPEDEKETHESQQKSELNTANYSRTKPD